MNKYPINNVYITIQGEGVQAGIPMTLVRFQGCQVGCVWCDTKETWTLDPEYEYKTLTEGPREDKGYAYLTAQAINNAVYEHSFNSTEWVLLTGGEPALYSLKEIVDILHDEKKLVAIETSGTQGGHIDVGLDWIVVSPKFNMPGGFEVKPEYVEPAHEIKQVVGTTQDIERLDRLLEEISSDPVISLQPVSQSVKATELCVMTALERGWRLSLQLHKYIGQK